MKKLLLLLLLSWWQQSLLLAQTIDSAWFRNNYTKVEQYIPMRDGVKLFTSIYIPKNDTEKHPILMTRTPYSCAPYGADQFKAFYNNHYREYLREGYIMVTQDVRGRWMSEGEFVDVRPFNHNKKSKADIDESSDTYDTVDWLVKNLSSSNGNVGIFGISYPGFYSSMAAASGHPAVKAVSPQAPVTDWFMGDDFHHNGAFFPMDGFSFYSSFGKPRPKPTTVGAPGFEFPTKDNYNFYLNTGALPNLAKLMGDSIKFWKDMYAHPNYDAWWQARDARRAMKNIQPAMLVVGGLFDAEDCFGAWELYKAIEKQNPSASNKLVMGPWYHGQWARGNGSSLGNVRFHSKTSEWYAENIEIPFFNYHLKGKGNNPNLAEATIFYTGSNEWKQEKAWPPAAMQETPIYLTAGGKLSFTKPSATSGESAYTSDPNKPVPYTEDVHFRRTREYMTDDQRFAARRPDVLVFQTEPLTEDLTLGGPVTADLKVKISTTDADFVVKLIDVFPDNFEYPADWPTEAGAKTDYIMNGYQMLVRGEIMRGRYRNSFEKPMAFTPGKTETVKFHLPDVAHTFKKGHRLMIQVQSSWFPLADRNPQQFVNIYQASDKDFVPSLITIEHNANSASNIVLPIIK
ncbi:CocE/NonD family hydrolase [Parasegetibacter sp. NRK P23]|uniref:CocE/NonD family hydrolase n=1 Tax=Parasegetibacter sp. NRK P23 TaxID=2942999 RepID=UPI002042F8F4|nr:CocE/NonD family hydrolase [Parasegetibacter sp. NRK P23]MCM5528122.1 CocE/NonD family hydrolase [Parasegetibacter sp. NRK P23]